MTKSNFYKNARTDFAGPLDGVNVIEVTTTWAGPMAGCMLADLGATVTRIEHPDGDVSRRSLPFYDGTDASLLFCAVNRNKRSGVLDLHLPSDQDLLRELVRSADVFIENFRPGTLATWNLGYDELAQVKSDLIFVSISGFGQFGSLHELPGYDPLVQMMSGWASLNGPPEISGAMKAPTTLGDDLAGIHAALAALAALRHRDQTGEGQHVDVSLFDCMLFQSNANLIRGALGLPLKKTGNRFGGVVPGDVYACSDDRELYLAVLLDKHWKRLEDMMAVDGFAINSDFTLAADRARNRQTVDEVVGAWLRSMTLDTALKRLGDAGIAAAPVLSFVEAAQHPHVAERDMIQEAVTDSGAVLPVVGPPVKFSRTPLRVRNLTTSMGLDNSEIFGP